MNRDSFEKEKYVESKLHDYHVEIPEFPMKPKWKKVNRVLSFLASPTKDPLETSILSFNGVVLLKVTPLVVTIALTFLQAFALF